MKMRPPLAGFALAGLLTVWIAACRSAEAATGPAKGRRQVAAWLVYDQEKGFDRISQSADLLTSLSVFGDPPKDFIERCHRLGIEVYHGVGGDASAFDTPAQTGKTIDGYLQACRDDGYDGIDLDFENLDASLQAKYSGFLRQASAALHKIGKKLSHCVGFYQEFYQDPPQKKFYDPAVVGKTCDMIRLMAYDMYYAPGRCDRSLQDRPDCQGMGPTSSYPWAKTAVAFWLKFVPRRKLILGLPAYSNDYVMAPCPQGVGAQVYAAKPDVAPGTFVQRDWLWYEKINAYSYRDSSGTAHMFFASDAQSTRAHLRTVDELDIPGIGFWHFSSVDPATWDAVRQWLKGQ